MLFCEHPCSQRFFRVAIQHLDRMLQDNCAGIDPLFNKVHGAARDANTVFQGLLRRVEAGKRRQQGGVAIQHAALPVADETRGKHAPVASEADHLHAVFAKERQQRFFVVALFAAAPFQRHNWHAEPARCLNAWCPRDIADDNRNLAASKRSIGDGLCDCSAVGAASANQDAKPYRGVFDCVRCCSVVQHSFTFPREEIEVYQGSYTR